MLLPLHITKLTVLFPNLSFLDNNHVEVNRGAWFGMNAAQRLGNHQIGDTLTKTSSRAIRRTRLILNRFDRIDLDLIALSRTFPLCFEHPSFLCSCGRFSALFVQRTDFLEQLFCLPHLVIGYRQRIIAL